MNEAHLNQLKIELRQSGVESEEINSLTKIAKKLRLLKYKQFAYQDFSRSKKSRMRTLRPYFAGALILAILALPIIIAQSVQPTNWLFPVQKLSDNVAISMHPRYRADVMMKRSEQVNTLVASHADSSVILATLDDYSTQAKSYQKMSNTSYAAMGYCETNLKQAASKASPEIKKAIQDSLDSLES